jgi:hypothetical protein
MCTMLLLLLLLLLSRLTSGGLVKFYRMVELEVIKTGPSARQAL